MNANRLWKVLQIHPSNPAQRFFVDFQQGETVLSAVYNVDENRWYFLKLNSGLPTTKAILNDDDNWQIIKEKQTREEFQAFLLKHPIKFTMAMKKKLCVAALKGDQGARQLLMWIDAQEQT